MSQDFISKVMQEHRKNRKAMAVQVNLEWDEVLKLVVNDLIEKRNAPTNDIREHFDKVLRYYLTEDEFNEMVLSKHP